jgi:hypothetical protein
MIAANLAERHRKFGFTIKLTLLNAFLNGHRFCTSNGTVPFEVATNRMDYCLASWLSYHLLSSSLVGINFVRTPDLGRGGVDAGGVAS